jgi:putative ABC transport system permease protein
MMKMGLWFSVACRRAVGTFRSIFRKKDLDRSLDDELRTYLDLRTDEMVREGKSRSEAYRQARIELGGVEQVKEKVRDRRLGVQVDVLLQDVRRALRSIRKARVFSLVVVLVLGLGIGVTTAMLSTVHAALFKPLPFTDPDRLVMGRATFDGALNPFASGADYYDYRDQAAVFDALGALMPFEMRFVATAADRPDLIRGTVVSTNLFRTLGVAPIIGRDFRPDDGREGASGVVLISHEYWRRRFGGDPDVQGTVLTVDGTQNTIAGVMPAGFSFVADVDFWSPMRPDRDVVRYRDRHNWLLVGRLAPNVGLDQAQSQVDVISARLEAAYPESNTDKALRLTSLHEVLVEDYRGKLFALTVAIAIIFLLACGNVAGLLLARAPVRRTELAVRAALGAGRLRLLHQLLTESVVLGLLGGGLGVIIALWGRQLILSFVQLEVPGVSEVSALSPTLLALAVALSLAGSVLAGIYPAVASARSTDIALDLKPGTRSTVRGMRFRSGLIVAQVAFSVVLLVGAGLLIRSYALVRDVHPGFEAENVLTAEVVLPRAAYSEGNARLDFYRRLVDEAGGIPGVTSVGLVNALPIKTPRNIFHVYAQGRPDEEKRVFSRSVSSAYFETMQTELLLGRGIERADLDAPDPVFVVSHGLAQSLFPEENPVGRHLVMGLFGESITVEIVGVVVDVHLSGLADDPGFAVYQPLSQGPPYSMEIVVRAARSVESLSRAVTDAVWNIDGTVPVANFQTLERVIAESIAERRITAVSLSLYGLLPLLVAAIGLYAMLAFNVNQRRREIGIRMALGADAGRIVRLVASQGASLVGMGVVLGLLGALAAARLLQQWLFRVESSDVVTYGWVVVIVALTGCAAAFVPSWRAARSDPSVALRAE